MPYEGQPNEARQESPRTALLRRVLDEAISHAGSKDMQNWSAFEAVNYAVTRYGEELTEPELATVKRVIEEEKAKDHRANRFTRDRQKRRFG